VTEVAFVNASPLILLAITGRIELLRSVAGRVVVPSVVEVEALARASDQRTVRVLRSTAWIERAASISVPAEIEAWDLGAGEAAVLSLTARTPGSIAVVDDLAARHCGKSMGLQVIGTLGVVVRAKRAGVITLARPVMADLRASGLYIVDELVDRALREVGE